MKFTIRLLLVIIMSALLLGCVTRALFTKDRVRDRFVSQSQKNANYLELAKYWDDHASKQTIDGRNESWLAIWEKEGKAEITIGHGPYYGMIELIGLDEHTTLVKCYAWGAMTKRINQWRELIENAPED